jgi:hypothetical protein
MNRTLALAASAGLAAAGCIEGRLTVDIKTQVFRDGTCQRRVEYRYERVDSQKEGVRSSISPDTDPLRLYHRFPSVEPWALENDAGPEVHTVISEAFLTSPNLIGSDYWRRLSPRSLPSTNHVSFAMQGAEEGAVFDYAEVFLDPVSPLATLRLLGQLLLKRDNLFASGMIQQLQPSSGVSRGDLKRVYRDLFALPFSKAVTALAERPIFGPRERKEIEDLLKHLGELQEGELNQALADLVPGLTPEEAAKAVDTVVESWGDSLSDEMARAGLPLEALLGAADDNNIHFRATLVMPAPILRANTCVQGETATWEFDAADLYGRGFEMWARAQMP